MISRRHLLLGSALGLTILAVIQVSGDPDEQDPASAETAKLSLTSDPTNNTSTPMLLDVSGFERRPPSAPARDVFAAKSWYVAPPPPVYVPPPPPPPPQNLPPPPPMAPALPFKYLGRMRRPDGSWGFFLVKDNRVYIATEGEVLENTYRIEKISGGTLNLTYLPLNIIQSLAVGDPL